MHVLQRLVYRRLNFARASTALNVVASPEERYRDSNKSARRSVFQAPPPLLVSGHASSLDWRCEAEVLRSEVAPRQALAPTIDAFHRVGGFELCYLMATL